MHTYLCGHAGGEPEEYVRRAVEQRIDLITITDHIPMKREDIFSGRGVRMALDEMPRYRELVERAKQEGQRLGVEVLYGIESEYYPDENELHAMWDFIATEPFDFVIGSLHHQLPGFRAWLKKHGEPIDIANAYFRQAVKAIACGKYDTIAHPDLIQVYGTISAFDPHLAEASIREMLEAAVEYDTCLEVNTSGLIKQIYKLHPDPIILRWAVEMGVKLTLGSDAHQPEQVGQKMDEVIPLLKEIGFDRVHLFRQRKRESIALAAI